MTTLCSWQYGDFFVDGFLLDEWEDFLHTEVSVTFILLSCVDRSLSPSPSPSLSLSLSLIREWTGACTDASRPKWTPGPKSTWPVTWPAPVRSGWWEKNKKTSCPAPPAAARRSSITSTLTSTGWSTELCRLSTKENKNHGSDVVTQQTARDEF